MIREFNKLDLKDGKRKKGRPTLGEKRKTYKTISVRVEEEDFNFYNKFIEEKYGISIHTFFRKMIFPIMEKEITDNNVSIFESNSHEMLKKIRQVEKILGEIKEKIG